MTDATHSCGPWTICPACINQRISESEEQRRRITELEAERDALKSLLRDVLHEYQCHGWLLPTERRIKDALAAKEE